MNEHPIRILFVCIENSNRSQMAEAFAHIHGGRKVEEAEFEFGGKRYDLGERGLVNYRELLKRSEAKQ